MTRRTQQTTPEGSTTTDRPARTSRTRTLGRIERAGTAVLGGALLADGLRRRSLGGAVRSLAGGVLLYWAGSGDVRFDLPGTNGVDVTERSEPGARRDPPSVERSITVGKPADELAERLRDPDQLTRVVGPVADVTSTGDGRFEWDVRAPLGRRATVETALVEDRPGELLRWESPEGGLVPLEVTIRFRPAPGDRGTEVTGRVRVDPPGGALGAAAVERLGFLPDALAGKLLRRFKSLAETGEIPTLERNPSARGSGDLL